MKGEQNGQTDLFEQRSTAATPLPDLRAKLGILLQLLLAEAAGLIQVEGKLDILSMGAGDEQDHG